MSHHEHESCIDACTQCATACNHCFDACLKEPDVAEMADCIRLDRDCAQMCLIAVAFMGRGSPFVSQICQSCADICDACAEACEQHQHDHCQHCAEACRRCAEECRSMAGTAA
jgi:hypothetical protein